LPYFSTRSILERTLMWGSSRWSMVERESSTAEMYVDGTLQ
jgi:hypothetical protein